MNYEEELEKEFQKLLKELHDSLNENIAEMEVEEIEGVNLKDLEKNFTNDNIVDALGGLPPVKIHCSVLAHEALSAAYAKGLNTQIILNKAVSIKWKSLFVFY